MKINKTWAIPCALAWFVCCSAAHGQTSPWRVDDANVVFQVSANVQQDANLLRNYELISKVKQLRLEGEVQQAHVDALRGYSMLQELYLYARHLKAVSFEPLEKLSQLSSLTIRSAAFSGESLTGLPKLRKLDVAGCPISRGGFKAIGELRQLRTLNVECTGLDDESLADLQNLKMLTSLSLANYGRGSPNSVSDKGLLLLASFPFLEELRLPIAFSEPSAVAKIPTLCYLKQLSISSKTETDLQNISRFVGLELLYVDLQTLTPESAREIARLKRLQVLNTSHCQIPVAAVAALAACENLQAFYTENEHCPELLRMLVQLPSLNKLGLVSLSDDDAKLLKKASSLQSLSIQDLATDQAMAAIAELPHLNSLDLGDCTRQGILALKQAKCLEVLWAVGLNEEAKNALPELQRSRPQLAIIYNFL